MRNKDLRRVAALCARHLESPQASPVRGAKEEWALVNFALFAMPLLIEGGIISTGEAGAAD